MTKEKTPKQTKEAKEAKTAPAKAPAAEKPEGQLHIEAVEFDRAACLKAGA